MPLKLKLKVAGSPKPKEEDEAPTLPKIKIKPPANNGVSKPVKKESTKLKLNLSSRKHKRESDTDALLTGIPKQRSVPKVRVKPTRVPGDGYDSEAPDMEDDPLLEQGIIVRFLPDANLDFVQNAVESGEFSGLNIKWMTREKAVVSINGSLYSARLVELPTVTELYKTFDKKNIFKTMDLCQVLLVLRQINPSDVNPETDFEVPREMRLVHPLYQMSPKNELRPRKTVMRDGLVYPYENVQRRFRPRKVNHHVMDDIDNRVEHLLRLDEEAEESHYDIVDASQQNTQRFHSPSVSAASTPAAAGQAAAMEAGDDLEEELTKALETEDAPEAIDVGDTQMVAGLNDEIQEAQNDAEDDDEEDEEDDEDDDEDDEEDEDTAGGRQHRKMLEEEIADLEKAVEVRRKGLESATHKMMKMKIQTSYNTLKASLDSKKRELSKLVAEKNRDREIAAPERRPEAGGEEEEDEDEDDGDAEGGDGEDGEDAEEGEGGEEGDGDIDDLF